MRIGYILKKFPRLSETFILNEILALEEAGVEVEVFSLREPDDEIRHPGLRRLQALVTQVRPLSERSVFRVLEAWSRSADPVEQEKLAHYCRRLDLSDPWRLEALNHCAAIAPLALEHGIEHLHAHFASSAVATAGEVSLITGIPFSFTMHAKDIYRDTVSFPLIAERLHQADFARTVCEANARHLRDYCGTVAQEKLQVIYNGIDLRAWSNNASSREQGLIVAVGRLIEKKGFHILVDAASRLAAEGLPFRVVIVGTGEMGPRLQELIDDHGLASRVQLSGAMDQDGVRELLCQAQIVAAPCIVGADGNQDALPTVLLEAGACGTPAVATPIAGIPEIMRDGREGYLVQPGSSAQLAETLAHALRDPAECLALGEAARRRVEELFDIRRNVSRLARLFENSVRSRGGVPCGVGSPAQVG